MRCEIIFGCNRDATGDVMHPNFVEAAIIQIRTRVTTTYGGCTVIDGLGSWKPKRRPMEHERCKVLVIDSPKIDTDKTAVKLLAEYIKAQLNQQCVIVTYFNCESVTI